MPECQRYGNRDKQEWRLKTLDIVTTAGSAGNIIAATNFTGTQV
jgi:hypothetical protein